MRKQSRWSTLVSFTPGSSVSLTHGVAAGYREKSELNILLSLLTAPS
jgi:hypothetical protein